MFRPSEGSFVKYRSHPKLKNDVKGIDMLVDHFQVSTNEEKTGRWDVGSIMGKVAII